MSRRHGDKILDNKYNTGQIEHEFFHSRDMRISDEYIDQNLDEYYNSEKYTRFKGILERIEIVTSSSVFSLDGHPKRKLPKARLNEYFCFIVDEVRKTDTTYSMIEFFIGTCEYLGCNYENMFKEMNTSYKEQLLDELDKDYHIFSKMNIKKLF